MRALCTDLCRNSDDDADFDDFEQAPAIASSSDSGSAKRKRSEPAAKPSNPAQATSPQPSKRQPQASPASSGDEADSTGGDDAESTAKRMKVEQQATSDSDKDSGVRLLQCVDLTGLSCIVQEEESGKLPARKRKADDGDEEPTFGKFTCPVRPLSLCLFNVLGLLSCVHLSWLELILSSQHPGCEETFTSGFSLKRHQKKHSGQPCCLFLLDRSLAGFRPFKCEHPGCGRAFAEKRAPFSGTRELTRASVLSCARILAVAKPSRIAQTYATCLSAYRDLALQVSRHELTHDGARPFACPHQGCGRAFARRSILQNHIITTHSGAAAPANRSADSQAADAVAGEEAAAAPADTDNDSSTMLHLRVSGHGTVVLSASLSSQPAAAQPESSNAASIAAAGPSPVGEAGPPVGAGSGSGSHPQPAQQHAPARARSGDSESPRKKPRKQTKQ